MSTEDKDSKKGPQIGIKLECIISVRKTGYSKLAPSFIRACEPVEKVRGSFPG